MKKIPLYFILKIPFYLILLVLILTVFSFYGDVTKVKILPHKQNVALVEFETATMACIARDHLDQVQMKGKVFKGFQLGFEP